MMEIREQQARWEGAKKDYLFRKYKDRLGDERIMKVIEIECGGNVKMARTVLEELCRRAELMQVRLPGMDKV